MAKVVIPENDKRKSFTIYARDIRSLNFFLETPEVPVEDGDREIKDKFVPIHKRRKGPSDTAPVNVSESTREYMVDPSLKSGNALPGTSYIFKTTENADVDEQRQFTFVGRIMDVVAYFDRNMKYETYFYPANGARKTLRIRIAQEGG